MRGYFRGRRLVGGCSVSLEDGRARIDCSVYEHWQDIDRTTTARCGVQGSCSVAVSEGISEQTSMNFESSIEASIGVQGVLGLKQQIKSSMGVSVNWSHGKTDTRTFSFKAPDCGRSSLNIFQLVRDYELEYYRKRRRMFLLEPKDQSLQLKWKRSLIESVQNYECFVDNEEVDETCNCPGRVEEPWDGDLTAQIGRLILRSAYKRLEGGLEVGFPGKNLVLSSSDSRPPNELGWVSVKVLGSALPKIMSFLGGIDNSPVEILLIDSSELGVDFQPEENHPEDFTSIVTQPRNLRLHEFSVDLAPSR